MRAPMFISWFVDEPTRYTYVFCVLEGRKEIADAVLADLVAKVLHGIAYTLGEQIRKGEV